MKTYEGMFIFLTTIKEQDLEKVLTSVRKEITRAGGTVSATDVLGRRQFARPMKKKNEGQYVKIAFEMDPGKMDALEGRLKLITDIFRWQIMYVDLKRAAAIQATRKVRKVEPEDDDPVAGGMRGERGGHGEP